MKSTQSVPSVTPIQQLNAAEILELLRKHPELLKQVSEVLPTTEPVNPETPDRGAAEREAERKKDDRNPFPLHELPKVIRDLAKSFHTTYQDALPETIALPMITIIGASLGRGICSWDGNRRTFPNIFTYVDLKTGGFKSTAYDEAMAPALEFNKKREKRHAEYQGPKAKAEIMNIDIRIAEIKKAMSRKEEPKDEYEHARRVLRLMKRGVTGRDQIIDEMEKVDSAISQFDSVETSTQRRLDIQTAVGGAIAELGKLELIKTDADTGELVLLEGASESKLPAPTGFIEQLTELERDRAKHKQDLEFWNLQSSDATVEVLAKKGAALNSLLISTDEASIVESIVAGKYSSEFTNEGFFCKVLSGGSYDRERVKKEENASVDSVIGTMLLMGQPHITRRMYQNEDMQLSGFIPRFIFGNVPYDLGIEEERPALSEQARQAYRTMVMDFYEKYWSADRDKTLVIGFSKPAQEELRKLRNELVAKFAGRFDDLDGLLARAKEQAMKISIILHAVKSYDVQIPDYEPEIGDTSKIDKAITVTTVRSAFALVRWSLYNYLGYQEQLHEDAMTAMENRVLAVLTKSKEPMNNRHVWRKLRSEISGAKQAQSILDALLGKGRVEEIYQSQPVSGRARNPLYRPTK